MIVNVEKTSFAGGEWSKSLYSRHDLAKYSTAVKKMENFIPSPHGGVFNRAGTKYIAGTKLNTGAILIPFQYNIETRYMLEFGNNYIRVFKDGVYLNTEIVTTYAVADLFELKYVQDSNTMYLFHHNYTPMKITRTSDTVWSFGSVVFGASVSAPTSLIRASGTGTGHNYAVTSVLDSGEESIVSALISGGVGDKISWTNSQIVNHNNIYEYKNGSYGYLGISKSKDFIIPSNVDPNMGISPPTYKNPFGNIAKQPSEYSPAEIAFLSPFTYDSVNNSIKGTGVSSSGFELTFFSRPVQGSVYNISFYINITSGTIRFYPNYPYTDGYVVLSTTGTYTFTYSAGNYSPSFAMANSFTGYVNAISVSNPLSYPCCGIFDNQRLLFGGTKSEPQTVRGSNVGSYTNLNSGVPIKDSDSFSFTINSKQVNEIRWMANLNGVIIGTAGTEWLMTGDGKAITPTNVSIKLQSEDGVAHLSPLTIGNNLLFLENSEQVVREFVFSNDAGSYVGTDMTVLANHLFKDHTIVSWCFQRRPHSIVWAVRDDGVLLGFTYFKEHDIAGWHQHTTDGLFEYVASIPSDTGFDDVYCIVNRFGVRYIEMFQPRTSSLNGFLDCSAIVDNPIPVTYDRYGNMYVDGLTDQMLLDNYVDANRVQYIGQLDPLDDTFLRIFLKTQYAVGCDIDDFSVDNMTEFDGSFVCGSGSGILQNNYFIGTGGLVDLNFTANVPADGSIVVKVGSTVVDTITSGSASHSYTRQFTEGGYVKFECSNPNSAFLDITVNSIGLNAQFTNPAIEGGVYPDGSIFVPIHEIRITQNSVSGLSRFNGQTIHMTYDGVATTALVSAGSVSIPAPASIIYVGLPYTQTIETLDFVDEQSQMKGKIRDVKSVVVSLTDTYELNAGANLATITTHPFRSIELNNSQTELYSGDVEMTIDSNNGRNSGITIVNTKPLPIEINSIIARIENGEH